MFLLLDILGAIGAAAVIFSAALGLGAKLGGGTVPATMRREPSQTARLAAPDALETRLAAALERATAAAARQAVALSFATEPGLAPRLPATVLDAALDALLAGAIAATPAGKVLVTARRRGGTVMIAVADDGAAFNAAARRAALRETEAAVALQGGQLEIAGMAGEGGTMRLLLPVPMGAGARDTRPAAAQTAAVFPARETATTPA